MSEKYRRCDKCGDSASQNPTLILHTFPRAGKAANLTRVRLWAQYCFPSKSFTEEQLKAMHRSHKTLCNKHFDRSAYTNDSMTRLNPNALPGKLLTTSPVPGPSHQSECLEASSLNAFVPQPCTQTLDATQVSLAMSSDQAASKSKQYKKCKKYINKIYQLKKALKKVRGSKRNGKLLKAISGSVDLEKLNQHLKPAFGLLLQSQMKNTQRKLTGRRWTLQEKIIALMMFKKSSASYKLLRRLFCLPNPGTLKLLLNNVPLPCGVNNKVMASLRAITNEQSEEENLCVLLFDEMSIRKNLMYNPKTDEIDGFQDHGHGQGRSQQVASHALVFMLVGLRKRWKQPIAHYLSGDSVTADRLQALIKEVLAECFKNDLNVVATVCDMDGVNIKAINALGSSTESPYFTFQGNEVVTIMDPPHLLKCFRNNFLKHDIECPYNFALSGTGGVAKWKHIEEFYQNEKTNTNFVYAPSLTDQHLNPNGKQKMRVKLAAQVLSNSVTGGMLAQVAGNEISSEAIITAKVIGKIDAIFDALNADTPDRKRGKPYATNMTKRSGHEKLFSEMKIFFSNIKFIGARSVPPSLNGWVRTINAVDRLWNNMKKYELDSLCTRRLNQDPLENLFGCIRSNCGSNPNPNVQQFIAGLKTSVLSNINYKSLTKNCEDDTNSLLNNMTTYLKTKQSNTLPPPNELYDNIDINITPELEKGLKNAENQACAYVSGFIFKKLQNNKCEHCKKCLLAEHIEPAHMFNTFKEYSEKKTSLHYVSLNFIKCVQTSATYINVFLKSNCSKHFICKTLTAKLKEILSFSWLDGCQQHKNQNMDELIKHVLAITIKRYCVMKNRVFATEASGNALKRKLKILKNQ